MIAEKVYMSSGIEAALEFRQSRRAYRCRIKIDKKGKVIVVVPNLIFGRRLAEKFLNENLDWVNKKLAKFNSSVIALPDDERDYLNLKKQALDMVCDKLEKFNKTYNFEFNKVSIKRHSSRWGSCSSKKNLNFNYKLVYLEDEIRDYLVVHELCHLKQMNHSKKFWDLVCLALPDYKNIKKKLRRFRI